MNIFSGLNSTIRHFITFALALLLYSPLGSFGQSIEGVFQARQIVANYSTTERNKAARKALREILVRYSGSKDILHEAAIAPLMQNPDSLLSSFKYFSLAEKTKSDQAQPVQDQNATSGQVPPGQPVAGLGIAFEFDGQLIRNHFVREKLPIWSGNRPRLVTWWVVDDQRQRSLVKRPEQGLATPGLVQGLEVSAHVRGLPLVLPLMDAQDQHSVKVNDVWTLDYDRLEVASRRYKPGAILVAKSAYTLSGQWLAQWGLISDGRLTTGRLEANGTVDLAKQIVDQVTEVLAKEYSVVVKQNIDKDAPIQLVIHNINQLRDYARVSEYLEKLMLVKYLGLVRVEPGKLIFDLELHGGIDQFRRQVRLDTRLSAISSVNQGLASPGLGLESSPQNFTQIEYRWINREESQ